MKATPYRTLARSSALYRFLGKKKSQSVQAIFRAFRANIDTTRELRMKYPWRPKQF